MILILAGNQQQFDRYIQEDVPSIDKLRGRRFVYFRGVDSIRGTLFHEIRFVGTWWANYAVSRTHLPELFTMLSVASGYGHTHVMEEPEDTKIEASL